MFTHSSSTKSTQSATTETANPQSEYALPYADQRPEAATQLKLQALADNSTVVRQLQSVQRLADTGSAQKNTTGLPDQLKSGIEHLSGYSMNDVRVHYNSPEPAALQAHAFAQGSEVHLASGQEQHLPHEAWHVVQQKQGRVKATRQLKGKTPLNDDPGLEREADTMGEKALQFAGRTPTEHLSAAAPLQRVVQRAPADFQDHPILGIEAKTGLFRTSYWTPLQDAIRRYSNLTNVNVKERKKVLREIGVFAERWLTARGIPPKTRADLDEAEKEKYDAIVALKVNLTNEYRGLHSSHGDMDVPFHTSVLLLDEDPELTVVADRNGTVKRGVLLENTVLRSATNGALDNVPEGTVCRITNSTVRVGGNKAEMLYKVSPAPQKDSAYGPVRNFREDYAKKDKIAATEIEKTESNFVYEDRFDRTLHPLFQGPPSVEDVEQSSLGDCYLLAAILAIVRNDPDHFLQNMVDHGDGVVSVRLFEKNPDNDNYRARVIDVRKSVVVKKNEKTSVAEAYNKGAIWVQLLEKAYIMAGFTGTSEKTQPTTKRYWSQLIGGQGNVAFGHLTGRKAKTTGISSIDPKETDLDRSWIGRPDFLLIELDRVDGTRALSTAFNLIKDELATALSTLKGSKDEVRHSDAEAVIRRIAVHPGLADAIVAFAVTERKYPGKRGKAVYTFEQIEAFQAVVKAIRAGKLVTASTNGYIKRGNNNHDGQSGGENVHNGLAGPHAYEVISFQADGITPDAGLNPTPGRICWIKLRNPWGKKGRLYRDTGTNLDMDENSSLPVTGKMEDREGENAEFWIPLEDFTKRFNKITEL